MWRTLLIVAVLSSTRSAADCASWSFKVWPPPGTVIPPNARLVIQGYDRAQEMVAKIAGLNPRLLVKSPDPLTFSPPIRLKVVEVHTGEMKITQAVLQPERLLIPGAQYTLAFEHTVEDPDFAPKGPLRWMAGGEPDSAAPTWSAPPLAGPGHFKQMGCGPIEEARVQLAVKDQSPWLVLSRVHGPTGGVREYLLTPDDEGELTVGHSMCMGAFQLGEGEWSLELVAVDVAGNSAPAPGGPLRFKGLDARK